MNFERKFFIKWINYLVLTISINFFQYLFIFLCTFLIACLVMYFSIYYYFIEQVENKSPILSFHSYYIPLLFRGRLIRKHHESQYRYWENKVLTVGVLLLSKVSRVKRTAMNVRSSIRISKIFYLNAQLKEYNLKIWHCHERFWSLFIMIYNCKYVL